ncbi:MAG: hypothetical protein HY804_11770 [Nitrospinae bacterium]|nr:hypothetical protein [Nitrospinota bacterium]
MTGTTTIRVRKKTRARLKKLSARSQMNVGALIDALLDRHEASFWDDFDREAKAFLDKDERRVRAAFEGVLKDKRD